MTLRPAAADGIRTVLHGFEIRISTDPDSIRTAPGSVQMAFSMTPFHGKQQLVYYAIN